MITYSLAGEFLIYAVFEELCLIEYLVGHSLEFFFFILLILDFSIRIKVYSLESATVKACSWLNVCCIFNNLVLLFMQK